MKKFIFFILVFLALASMAFAEYKLDEDINMLGNDITNTTNIYGVVVYQDGNVVIDTSTVGSYTTDTNATTECSSGEYLDGALGCVNFNDTVDAQDVIYNTTQTTYTDAQDVIYNTTMTTYVNAEDIVYNTTMTGYVDAQNVVYNTSQTSYANALNVSMTAFVNAMDVIYNTTMTTYVNLMNATMTTYVNAQDVIYNTTMTTYANLLNSTMTTYVDAQDVIYNTTMTAYADLHCALTGCTMAGNIAMGGNDITGAVDINSTEFYQDGNKALDVADSFSGDVSGTYDNTVVADDSHTHEYQNITNEPWIEDSQESSLNVNNSNSTDYWDNTATADDFTNIIASGNITAGGYISGQPNTGAIGSGVINSSDNLAHCGCMNVSKNQDLEVHYPEFTERIVNTDGNVVHCYKADGDMNVTDNQHSTYYLNSSCDWNSDTFENFHDADMSPGGKARVFDVYAIGGDIEETKGNTLLHLAKDKSEQIRIFCPSTSHLTVCNGFDITTDTFPSFNVSSGNSVYLNTYLPTDAKSTLADETHLTHHTNGVWVHTNATGFNITHCDNGTDLVECTGTVFRQYPGYSISWNADAKIHMLSPLTTGNTYTSLSACKEATPDYVLPAMEEYVAIVHHIYCARRTDSSWDSDAWVDLRVAAIGAGGTPDLSIYLVEGGTRPLTANWATGDYNITSTNGYYTGNTLWSKLQGWDNFTGIPTATPSDGDTTHLSTADHIRDYVIGLGYSTTTGTVTSIATTAPIAGGTITTTGTISLAPCADTQGLLYNDTSSAWECETIAGSGDITGVTTDGSYLTGGCLSGTCDLLMNETSLNATIAANAGDDANWNKTYADTLYRADSWNNFTGIPHATPSNGDVTHFSYADEIYDWVISLAYATTAYVDSLGNWSADKSQYWNTSLDLDTVISDDEISEAKIEFTTACAAGNYYRLTGNDLECTTPTDTTYSAGNGISEAATVFSVAGNTCLTQDADGLSVTGDCVGDTQLEYNTGQHLTTTTGVTFATVDTGNGAYELFAMNQDVESTDGVTFATVNTGNGAYELFAMNQDVESTDAVTFATLDTGQGANELYDMDQNVLEASDVKFNALNLTSNLNIIQNKVCYDAACAAYEYYNGTCFIRYIGGSTLNHCPP